MDKNKVNTSYVYEILKKDEVQQYLESKDITANEKSCFQSAVTRHANLYKTIRMKKHIIVSQSVAGDLIKEDSNMIKFRMVMYILLLSLSIILCGIISLDPVIHDRNFVISDIVLIVLTFSMTVCMGLLVCDTFKDNNKIKISKEIVSKENKSVTEINIELRNSTV